MVKPEVDTLLTVPDDPPSAGPDRALDPPPDRGPLPPGTPCPDAAPAAGGDVAVAEVDVEEDAAA
jgi:hypothetical protein